MIDAKFKRNKSRIHKSVFVAKGATVTGDTEILENSSIWYGCVIRADVNFIKIGSYTNIQDGTIVHVGSYKGGQTIIGSHVTIGHLCVLHACKLHDNTFVGMGSVVMDNAVMEENSMVGAGSLVTEGKIIKSGQLWTGRPAKYKRDLTKEEIEHIKKSAQNYKDLALEYL